VSDSSFPLTERFSQAMVYAHRLHKGQYRKKSGVPYVAHLLAVSSLVLEAGADEDEAVAALLHDAAEDQGGEATLAEIEGRFGTRVAAIVRSCSDTFESPKPPWEPRKRAHLEHLLTADTSTLLVIAADKLHNARDTLEAFRSEGPAVWDRFHASREQTLWFYRAVEEIILGADDERVSELGLRLSQVVDALESATGDTDATQGENAGRDTRRASAPSGKDVTPSTRAAAEKAPRKPAARRRAKPSGTGPRKKAEADRPQQARALFLTRLEDVLSGLARGNTSEARKGLASLQQQLSAGALPQPLRQRAEADAALALEILEGSGPHLAARAASRLGTLREILLADGEETG